MLRNGVMPMPPATKHQPSPGVAREDEIPPGAPATIEVPGVIPPSSVLNLLDRGRSGRRS